MKTFRGNPVMKGDEFITTIFVQGYVINVPSNVRSITEPIEGICTVSFNDGGSFTFKKDELRSIKVDSLCGIMKD